MIAVKAYLRQRAVAYAAKWALGRNPLFYDFTDIGGDCTNFVSQCILAGSCVMNFTPDFGWYYRTAADRAPAWTGVDAFWRFFTGAPDFRAENGGIGPFGRAAEAAEVEIGDAVQLGREDGRFYHTLLVTDIREGELYVSAHTINAYNRPLSSYTAPLRRYLHLRGVAFPLADGEDCYTALLNGETIG